MWFCILFSKCIKRIKRLKIKRDEIKKTNCSSHLLISHSDPGNITTTNSKYYTYFPVNFPLLSYFIFLLLFLMKCRANIFMRRFYASWYFQWFMYLCRDIAKSFVKNVCTFHLFFFFFLHVHTLKVYNIYI